MKIRLLFFASCRQVVGRRHALLKLKEGLTVAQFKGVLTKEYPGLESHLETLTIAVNSEYINDDQVLETQDVVALISPVTKPLETKHWFALN